MSLDTEDTIVAIASAVGGAYRGIIRLSGPSCAACLERCFVPRTGLLSKTRQASIFSLELRLPGFASALSADLFFWPTSRSYTRQPAAELHTIGSPPLLQAALAALTQAGARLARPGEFTLRAFLAGRLDLTQAEAVLGVIDASGDRQLAVALSQLAGGLALPLNRVRGELLDLLAHLEAGLDFAEEEIEFISRDELLAQLHGASGEVSAIGAQMQSRGDTSAAPRVVLCGLPNVGKSSLLNALAGEEAAMVSEIAGTTRDYVSRRVRWDGVELELVDTAGTNPDARPESIAFAAERARDQQVENCQLRLWCVEARDRGQETGDRGQGTGRWGRLPACPENRILAPGARGPEPGQAAELMILTKCDLTRPASLPAGMVPTSSVTGQGIAELRKAIATRIQTGGSEENAVASTAARCRESLTVAGESLERAMRMAETGVGEEFIAAELRLALEELGRVAGVVYTDDILDRVFSRFCIGK